MAIGEPSHNISELYLRVCVPHGSGVLPLPKFLFRPSVLVKKERDVYTLQLRTHVEARAARLDTTFLITADGARKADWSFFLHPYYVYITQTLPVSMGSAGHT